MNCRRLGAPGSREGQTEGPGGPAAQRRWAWSSGFRHKRMADKQGLPIGHNHRGPAKFPGSRPSVWASGQSGPPQEGRWELPYPIMNLPSLSHDRAQSRYALISRKLGVGARGPQSGEHGLLCRAQVMIQGDAIKPECQSRHSAWSLLEIFSLSLYPHPCSCTRSLSFSQINESF